MIQMSEEEAKAHLKWLLDDGILAREDEESVQTLLQLLEQKDKRIDDLEKALVDESIKSTEKINKLKDKLIGDKMEQFDDYIIYLIESYLEILEE